MHPSPAEAKAAEMFAIDVLTDGRHGMSVLMSDGRSRRHLAFRRSDTGLYWFDLVTWPGCLVFNGDMGTWVFQRSGTDMLRFFAGTRINPGYWAEKVQAGDTREYDPELARTHVTEAYDDHVRDSGLPVLVASQLWGRILRDVLDEDTLADEARFRAAVQEFEYMDPRARNRTEFTFGGDTWEWDLRGFRHHFLYACFAIQWGVNRYLGLHQPDLSDLAATIPAPPAPASPARHQPVTAHPRPEFL